MSRTTLPLGLQIVYLYDHHEVTTWKGSKVWHDLTCESIFLFSGLESSAWGAECCLLLNVSSQITSNFSLETVLNKLLSSTPLSFHLIAIACVFGTKLNKSSLWWLYLSNICCLLSCSLKSFLGPSSVFLVSLISPHKSVPLLPSSFLLLFSELSPICLHISTAGCLNIICWTKSHIRRDLTN